MYKLKEGREMKAETFSKLVATSLYEKRYVVLFEYLVNNYSA
jgi:20S proteasome alpha/beta subunit